MISPVRPDVRSVSDARLVQRFAAEREEAAFEELVRRYGGMIRGTCRRVLGPGGDADDAAQRAFLSLAAHSSVLAGKLAEGGSLTGWLYRVAVNAALQQRRAAVSRRRREATVTRERPAFGDGTAESAEHAELVSLLDEELTALPAPYRNALILCHLQGKTQHEAAETLGLSYGTLRRRLDVGKRLLRDRLTRRGVAATAVALSVILDSVAEAAPFAGPLPPLTAAGGSGGFVTPYLAEAARVPVPKPVSHAALSAKAYASALAGLIVLCAIPPVVMAVTTDRPEPPTWSETGYELLSDWQSGSGGSLGDEAWPAER